MTKRDEQRLAEVARKADRLRETISTADKVLRAWKNRRIRSGSLDLLSEKFYLSLSARDSNVSVCGYVLASVVAGEFIPMMERIRDQAKADLKALKLP